MAKHTEQFLLETDGVWFENQIYLEILVYLENILETLRRHKNLSFTTCLEGTRLKSLVDKCSFALL